MTLMIAFSVCLRSRAPRLSPNCLLMTSAVDGFLVCAQIQRGTLENHRLYGVL